ncbi:hypothetical protein [Mucilaginibacter lappiensis]|uniref:Peptidase family M23 n=1 Tax=Mucilaginibacter lappiensis TaxID=354630 RepID=A0A841JGC1_9SPHI|nr:hypothetical protein [Mucilaginibacter lappiensis]MBB6129352.1 hypothetical protein [Mucilaginibacter lappiensis]
MIKNLKITALILFIFSISFKADAQEQQVNITYIINTDKSVDLSFEKPDPGTYTVILKFNTLTNSDGQQEQTFNIKGYSGRFLTLRPQNKEQGIGFSYRYSYIRGRLNPKYNADFVYLLPCKRGSKVTATETIWVGTKYFGKTSPEDWKAYRFYTKNEDTVTAIRKGVVVEIQDSYDTEKMNGVEFTNNANKIVIEHQDGTLATYTDFKKGSIMVKVGQTIFPETALGINSRANGNGRFNISLSIIYLKLKDFESTRSLYGFVTPHFDTSDSGDTLLITQKEYTAADTPEIIGKELSKKEFKKTLNN